MKLLIGGVVVLALLGAGNNADAWPWSKARRRDKLPKPIDRPIVRPKMDDSHKNWAWVKRHPERLQRNDWGSEMHLFKELPDRPNRTPYLFQE